MSSAWQIVGPGFDPAASSAEERSRLYDAGISGDNAALFSAEEKSQIVAQFEAARAAISAWVDAHPREPVPRELALAQEEARASSWLKLSEDPPLRRVRK